MARNLLQITALFDDIDERPDEQAAALRVLTQRGALDVAWMLGIEVPS